MLLSLTLAATIAIPGMLIRWVFLQRPVNWFTALAIAAPTWLLLLWWHHVSVSETGTPPAFISLGGIFLFMALVAPLKKLRTFPPKLSSPELPIIKPEAPLQLPPELENPYGLDRKRQADLPAHEVAPMTDRYHSLTVTLEKDIREDDAQSIIKSIQMIRGVLSVKPHVSELMLHVAQERARFELEQKIMAVIGRGEPALNQRP